MPLFEYTPNYTFIIQERKKKEVEMKRKHDEIVRAWKAGELTWNEYCKQEKKYRT